MKGKNILKNKKKEKKKNNKKKAYDDVEKAKNDVESL